MPYQQWQGPDSGGLLNNMLREIYGKLAGVPPAATEVLRLTYPVGSVYISVNPTNPAALFGFGTWAAFAKGRALVGYDASDADWSTVEATKGAKTHTLTITEMPAHTHLTYARSISMSVVSGPNGSAVYNPATGDASGSAGGGGSHNNIQPSIVVYMWKRTA